MNPQTFEELKRVNKLVYSIGLQQKKDEQTELQQQSTEQFSLQNYLSSEQHAINLSFYGLQQIFSHDEDHFDQNISSLFALANENHCNQVLDLSHNLLMNMDEEPFATISTLFFKLLEKTNFFESISFLILKNNDLKTISISSKQLTYLDISKNNLESIDLSCLPSHLQYLNLSYNLKLETISFENCSFLNQLKELHIQSCHCKQMSHFFIGNSLQVLQISNNQFSTLPFLSNSSCQLIILDASRNQITTVVSELLENCSEHLEQLFLQENQLTNLEFSKTMKKLSILDLSCNQLNQLSNHFFDVLPQLQRLELHTNQLQVIPKINNFELLEHISLHKNQLTTFPIDLLNFKWNYLYLQENLLKEIPKNINEKMPQLEELDLYGNQIKELPSGLFECKQLKKLCLDKNQLQSISNDVVNLTRLIYFSVYDNPQLQLNPFLQQFLNSKK